ncbi:hypothetical protein HNR65_001319 [Desulfosalsimonas propionicica]|uniref:Uncharacterized protein n=1 Tax=Desulfosalsimonas propionicica TaxID=332175 RepID=A0A7W0C896_9BACT|nr:hypothetical protein [Desulfosalsimonas propionicica]
MIFRHQAEAFTSARNWSFNHLKFEGTVKSLILDGAVKSSRSRLAQFRRMQRTYPYVKF